MHTPTDTQTYIHTGDTHMHIYAFILFKLDGAF